MKLAVSCEYSRLLLSLRASGVWSGLMLFWVAHNWGRTTAGVLLSEASTARALLHMANAEFEV